MGGDNNRGKSIRGSGRYSRRGTSSYHHYHYSGDKRRDGDEDLRNDEKSDSHEYRTYGRESGRPFAEDSRISKQLRRLSREDHTERFIDLVEQLQDSLALSENIKYVRRNSDHILDCLFETLQSAPSRPCKWEVASCLGQVGHTMDTDVSRFVELCLNHLESWKHTDHQVLVLRALLHLFTLDNDGHQLAQCGDHIMDGLHSILEGTETIEVMVATVDVFRKIHTISPTVIVPYFQDLVDILVGWHIDHSQPEKVITYVSLSLQGFNQLWPMNASFANTLLTQFVEDMEDYIEDPVNSENDAEAEASPRSTAVNAKKVASFISVFTTVVRCLGIHRGRSSPFPSHNFLFDSLKKMVKGAVKIASQGHEEGTLSALSKLCIVLVPLGVDNLLDQISCVLELYEKNLEIMSYSNQLSLLMLLKEVIQEFSSLLPVAFVKKTIGPTSTITRLRMSPCQSVWCAALKVYHALMGVKNVPLLQEAYKFILIELQTLQKVLIPDAKPFLTFPIEDGLKIHTEKEAEILFTYLIAVLAEVVNTRNSIITMWALTPPFVELLGINLMPSNFHLTTKFPQVQYQLLFLLYSHCSKHSHYITTSTLVVGPNVPFVSSSVMGTFSEDSPPFTQSSSTSENLCTVLTLVTDIMRMKKVTSSEVLCLCIEWSSDIIVACESSIVRLLPKLLFKAIMKALINLGYHFLNSVSKAVAVALSRIKEIFTYVQVLDCLNDTICLCLYYASHVKSELRELYLNLLSGLPLSAIFTCQTSYSPLNKIDYASVKDDTADAAECNYLDSNGIQNLQRQYMLKPSTSFPQTAFHHIMSFILHCSQHQNDKMWLENLFISCQRVENITKADDWNFSVLAPQLHVLLWRWAVWELANYCVSNKLRTSLGKPYDTFTTIETAIKSHAKEVLECGIESKVLQINTGSVSTRNQLLSVVLSVEFVESLERTMFNASDGCAISPQPSNKSVRIFFSTNRQTCNEWLTRIRAAVITVSLSSGQYHVALRHSYKLLGELVDNNNIQGVDFERAVCYCAKSLVYVGCEEALSGIYYWVKSKTGRRFTWIKNAALSAGKRYEKALEGHQKFMDDISVKPDITKGEDEIAPPSPVASTVVVDAFIKEFIQFQVVDCMYKLGKWSNLKEMATNIFSEQDESMQRKSGDLNFLRDTTHIEALCHFDNDNMNAVVDKLHDFTGKVNWNQKNTWPLGYRLTQLNKVLLCALTCVITQATTDQKRLDLLVNECQKETEWLVQLLPLVSHSNYETEIIISTQITRQLKSLLQNHVEDVHIHENWEQCQILSLPIDMLQSITRWTKLLSKVNPGIFQASVVKLEILSIKSARKFENYNFAENSLTRLLEGKPKSLLDLVKEPTPQAEFTVLTSKLHREAAKLLSCTGHVNEGCIIFSNIVSNLNPILATLAHRDPSLLSLPPNEAGQICARSILTLSKWWNMKDRKSNLLNQLDAQSIPVWMNKIINVYNQMKVYIPEELCSLLDVSHPSLPPLEARMSHILTLAAIQCPSLPKVWFNIASWSFRWGQHILSQSFTDDSFLHKDDLEQINLVLEHFLGTRQEQFHLKDVVSLIGRSNRKVEEVSNDDQEEDLRLEEIEGSQQLNVSLSGMFAEWGLDAPSINDIVNSLLEIRRNALKRDHTILTTAAKAYFRYLTIEPHASSVDRDNQMVATLRLLRLIVKHASELQDVLEKGLANTPTGPWRAIIPQLFARLGHPELYVRGSISDLLCRLAKDCSHLIIFPAVVGSSGVMTTENQSSITGMLDKYSKNTKSGQEGEETELKKQIPLEEDKIEGDEDLEELNLSLSCEDQKKKTLMRDCFSTLVNTLKKEVGASIAEVQTLIHELRRITVLWDELWLGTLNQHMVDLTKKCQQLKIDIGKMKKNTVLSQSEKLDIVTKKYEIVVKPILFILDHLNAITSAQAETPNEKAFQETYNHLIQEAKRTLLHPDDIHDPVQNIQKLKQMHQLLQQRAHKRTSFSLKMAEISPLLAGLTNTGIAMPGVISKSNEIVTIAGVCPTITVLPTKTKPKKLSFLGSDGNRYTYLFKGLEDLHLDQRIMQFLATVNTMLAKNKKVGDSIYRAHFYSVVPLGARSGLIQWVGNATPLFGLYKRWQQREAQQATLKTQVGSSASGNQQTSVVPRPSELYYKKLNPLLKEAGVNLDNRKDWPIAIMRDVFRDLNKETAKDLLARELWQSSLNAYEWWRMTYTYNLSTAVMSIIGYIIGLGDRHLDNLLVNLTTGEVVHIDYNVCFEKGKNLRVAERIPYRMTQNIEAALGVSGVEGIFRSACEHVLRTMRKGRETLLTLLEAFIYDPLVDWTPDSEAGYAGAVYGGNQTLMLEARHNRQELEHSLTITMFTVRLSEMKHEWMENKSEVLESLPVILHELSKWQTIHQTLAASETNMQQGHHLMATIKEAEANPHHTLYGIIARHKEHSIVKENIHQANELLLNKMKELNDWVNKYKIADKLFKSGQIGEIRMQLGNLGGICNSVAPVMEYISAAGQGQLASQCEQVEIELRHALSQIVSTCLNTIDPLSKYGNVWVNYPAKHLDKHRIAKHLNVFSHLQENLTLGNVQVMINQSHFEMNEEQPFDSSLYDMDVHFHSKTIQLNTQLQKIQEQIINDGLSNGNMIASSLAESQTEIDKFCTENGDKGKMSMVCALLNLLSQYMEMRHRADKALSSGIDLSDNTVGNLWWLNESMVSMNTISDIIGNINKYSPPSLPSEMSVLKAFGVLEDVFAAMQDLTLNTVQIIVVEGGRLLWQNEPSVIHVATRIKNIVDSCQISLVTLSQQLTHHLHMTIFRMPSVYESAVSDANNLHAQLMTLIQQLIDTSFVQSDGLAGNSEMSQGQMLLMGFHLLFDSIDKQLDRLINSLSEASLPHPWPRVDMIRMCSEIMGHVHDVHLHEIVRAILRVKKVKAISTFFGLAIQLFTDAANRGNQGLNINEEDQLCRVVRGYVGECVFRLLLGLPSYLATYFILIHAQKMDIDVTSYIESHDVGTEGRVSLEGLIEAALEKAITEKGLQGVIQNAATLANSHYQILFKKHKKRQWENESESIKVLLQRVAAQHVSHHWFYEDKLKQRGMTLQLSPNRTSVIAELRKSETMFQALTQNITELHEKYTSLTVNVMHRLKWAAGSNPNIAQALEEFRRSVELSTSTISEVLRMSGEVSTACQAICHYETMKVASVEALTEDNYFNTILTKVQESCMLVQRYPGSLSSQEELLIHLVSLPKEITQKWVKESATAVSDHLSSLNQVVSEHSKSLQLTEASVISAVEQLRYRLSTHHRMMSDVRVLLKSMAKFEQDGGIQGIDTYLRLYRRYSEIMSSLVRQLLHESITLEKITQYTMKIQQLVLQTYLIYDKLVEFGTQCVEDEEGKKSKDKRKDENRKVNFQQKSNSLFSMSKKLVGIAPPKEKRHPLTGKVLQEHNAYALSVWRRIKVKLEGKDPDPNKVASVSDQVDFTINEACCEDNLATLYEGWTAWV